MSSASMFSVATWNALADCYVRPATFPHCEPAILEWKSRSPLIWREVERLDADIVLLQEVDHVDEWKQSPALKGYETFFCKRPGIKQDGCLTAWRSSSFRVASGFEPHGVDLNLISQQLAKEKFRRDNTGSVVVLQHISSGRLLVVAQTHLFWNPTVPEVKFTQALFLAEHIRSVVKQVEAAQAQAQAKIASSDSSASTSSSAAPIPVPVVFGGDLNSKPGDLVYQFLTEGVCEVRGKGGAGTKLMLDCTFGKITKWLRALGIDCSYHAEAKTGFADLFETTRREGRVIVTQNKGMVKRKHCPDHLLLPPSPNPIAAFQQIVRHFGIAFDASLFYSRCTTCNGDFREVELAELQAMPFVGEPYRSGRDDDGNPLGAVICTGRCRRVRWWRSAKQRQMREELYSAAMSVELDMQALIEQQSKYKSNHRELIAQSNAKHESASTAAAGGAAAGAKLPHGPVPLAARDIWSLRPRVGLIGDDGKDSSPESSADNVSAASGSQVESKRSVSSLSHDSGSGSAVAAGSAGSAAEDVAAAVALKQSRLEELFGRIERSDPSHPSPADAAGPGADRSSRSVQRSQSVVAGLTAKPVSKKPKQAGGSKHLLKLSGAEQSLRAELKQRHGLSVAETPGVPGPGSPAEWAAVRSKQLHLLDQLAAAEARLAALERQVALGPAAVRAEPQGAAAKRVYRSHNKEWAVSLPTVGRSTVSGAQKRRQRQQAFIEKKASILAARVASDASESDAPASSEAAESAEAAERRSRRQQFADDNRLGLKSFVDKSKSMPRLTESKSEPSDLKSAQHQQPAPVWSMKMAPGAHSYSNDLRLVSAYANYRGESKGDSKESGAGEPETTNLTPAFCGTLDYILHSRDLLRCSRLHPLPSVADLTAGGRLGLPTAEWPSDHLALKAWLEFA